MVPRPQQDAAQNTRRVFPTTHWSVVLNAGAASTPETHQALATLCQNYWYPLYHFVRVQGKTHHEAEDLTQEFLSRLLAADGVARARPERGRFRTFLLAALKNFLINEWQRAQAEKRGRGVSTLPLEFAAADGRFANEPVSATITPEQAFDRSWALNVIDQALASLRTEYAASGRGALFDAISPGVWGGGAPEPLAQQAARLGLTESALKVALHRLRKRLRERLEENIAATVAADADVEDELRYLIAAVGSPAV